MKIDIYTKGPGKALWQYECSTMAHTSCKQAKELFCRKYNLDKTQVKACIADK